MGNKAQIHNRRSIRLKGYDYSKAGAYFITICIKDRKCLFGEIADKEMELNEAGKIANEFWLQIPGHFPNATLGEHIIMPNHIHGIIQLHTIGTQQNTTNVGTQQNITNVGTQQNTTNVGTQHVVSLPHIAPKPPRLNHNQFSKPIPGSVSVIIQQYKSSVKRWCNKNNHAYFQWQSRFYEHIIRNEQSYLAISEYIIRNPAKWNNDTFFTA